MEKTSKIELFIRALRGVIRQFYSDKQTDYPFYFRDKSRDTCYICKEKGHWATECPDRQKSKTGPRRDTSQDTCYHCKEKKKQKQEEERESEQEEEEVPSPKEEPRYIQKEKIEKKRRRGESKEEIEEKAVKKYKKQRE